MVFGAQACLYLAHREPFRVRNAHSRTINIVLWRFVFVLLLLLLLPVALVSHLTLYTRFHSVSCLSCNGIQFSEIHVVVALVLHISMRRLHAKFSHLSAVLPLLIFYRHHRPLHVCRFLLSARMFDSKICSDLINYNFISIHYICKMSVSSRTDNQKHTEL